MRRDALFTDKLAIEAAGWAAAEDFRQNFKCIDLTFLITLAVAWR